MDLTNIDQITQLLKKHKLHTKKHLGQNFLIDRSALEEIVKAADIQSTDHIIEVGPGLGVLTVEIAEKAKKVTSIEIDSALFPILKDTLSQHKNIDLLNEDALQFRPPKTPYKLVANIPYYITSPLINHFLQSENPPQTITLLIQKEVAEKACQLEPKASILSLQIGLFGNAKIVGIIKAESFFPAPKVDSAIIHIETHNKISIPEARQILSLAKRAFSNKRKKLSNTVLREIEDSPIDKDLRPQVLSIKDWQKLNNFFNSSKK
ncbi:ribosomal RNA small subunit methyltransferase A [Candidatus Peregrinibacteria bacterium]|nr:ribosomal RNA small subunit methyltransferase A [Candidatus Peregrinibacteria bacterium]